MILLAHAMSAELLAAGLLFCGYVVAAHLLPRVPVPLRWAGAAIATAWIASVEFHVLSTFHAFYSPGALGIVGISSLLALRIGGGDVVRRCRKRDQRWLRWVCRRIARSPYRGVTLAFVLLASVVVLHSLVLPPLGWDSLTYHAVKAGMWVQHAGTANAAAPGNWSLYRNFWAGAEVLTAWAMLPFHADTLAMGMQAVHWLVLGLGVVTLVRELGAREPYTTSIAALVLATPTIRMQVGTGYVEVAELAFLTSGMALGARFLRRPAGGSLLVAGAAFGLAAGVKFPFAPTNMAALTFLLIIALHRSRLHTPLPWVAAVCMAFLAGVAPWLWYAYADSGAPLSPVPLRIFGLDLGRANPEVEAYLDRPIPAASFTAELMRLLDALLRGYENPGLPTVIATVFGFVAWPRLLARQTPIAIFVLLVVATSGLTYYSPALAVVRHYWPASSVRFLLVPLVIAAGLSVIACRRRHGFDRFYLWFLWGGAFVDFAVYLTGSVSPRSAAGIVTLLAVLASLSVAGRWFFARLRSPKMGLATAAGATTVFLAVADIVHDNMRGELARMGFAVAPVAPYWLEAAALVDDPHRPRRIAVTSGPWLTADNWFAYPFLGRRLQNGVSYVPTSADGIVRHFGSPSVNEEYSRTADYASWVGRLRIARVTEIVSFSPTSIELAWMEDHPELFRRLSGTAGDWGLFAFEPSSTQLRRQAR